MSIFFVDANILLEFYADNSEISKLLDELVELDTDLFITEQVYQEVQRNRVKVAARGFDKVLNGLKSVPGKVMVPTQLDGRRESPLVNCSGLLNQSLGAIAGIRKAIARERDELVQKVAEGRDPMTAALKVLCEGALQRPSQEIMSRAQQRKQTGQPPGKPSDPLGDQISWEQLLENYGDIEQTVWIVTRDEDYFTKVGKRTVLNPVLYDELAEKVDGKPDVRVFDKLASALSDWSDAEPDRQGYEERKRRLEAIAQAEQRAAEEAMEAAKQQRLQNAVVAGGLATILGVVAASNYFDNGDDNPSN